MLEHIAVWRLLPQVPWLEGLGVGPPPSCRRMKVFVMWKGNFVKFAGGVAKFSRNRWDFTTVRSWLKNWCVAGSWLYIWGFRTAGLGSAVDHYTDARGRWVGGWDDRIFLNRSKFWRWRGVNKMVQSTTGRRKVWKVKFRSK